MSGETRTNYGLSDMTYAGHAPIERRLAAIMLADIAGFSALMERDETRTYQRLRLLREQIFIPKVAEYGGRVVKTTGDGFLAIFPSATASLGCGITIQRTNISQEATKDEEERFHLRIGINLGDVVIDGDDISGDGVNIAARLEPLAPSDGICVSGAIQDQVREDLGVELEDIGDQHVKNISRPVRAYRIDLAGASKMTLAAQPDTTGSLSAGVLARPRSFLIAACVLALAAALLILGSNWRSISPRLPAMRSGDIAAPLATVQGTPAAQLQKGERSGRVHIADDATIQSAAASIGVPLPEVLEFHQPSAEVPDELASYLGVWTSGAQRWNGHGRHVILIIESIDEYGEAAGEIGDSAPNEFTANKHPASYRPFTGKIGDQGLKFTMKDSMFRFQMEDPNEMYGEIEGFGDAGLFHSSIRLTRLK